MLDNDVDNNIIPSAERRAPSAERRAPSAERLNTDDLNRTVFISDNLPFLKSLDTGSVDLVVIDPPFGKTQTFVGTLKPPLTEGEKRVEREMLESWGVVDADSAYDSGLEYPDQTGTTAKFEDIWDFRVRVEKEEMVRLEGVCPGAYLLIQSTRYTHGDGTAAYIAFMVQRMLEIRRILAPTGSVYLHCDHEANAYLRQMMDAVFGASNFRNEIVWKRTSAHGSAKRWGPIHETLLYYTKGRIRTWNQTFQAHDRDYIENFYRHTDRRGRFRLSDLTAPGIRRGESGQPWRGIDPTERGRHWGVPKDGTLHADFKPSPEYSLMTVQERLDALDDAGFVHWPKRGSMPSYRRYLSASRGAHIQDVIWDIPPIGAQAKERTGYPTQKPQALAKRIIEASSNPDDLVLDCFAGCAYVPVAAELTGRRWIACDMSPRAWTVVRRQFHKQPDLRIVTEGEYAEKWTGMQSDLGDERIIHVRGPFEMPERTTGDDSTIPMRFGVLPEPVYRQRPVEDAQTIWEAFVDKWDTLCWYCGTEKDEDRRELQLDHIEPNLKDGSNDDCWNRALACVACNSDKGDRLTPEETIHKALEAGRIGRPALRDEQLKRFEVRHTWARERWEEKKPKRLPMQV